MNQKESDFLEAIERHKGIIVKVSKVYFDQLEDQEDLRQEIIYQLWNSYDSFRNESQFSTWMYRIAINTSILFFKKEKKKETHFNEFQLSQTSFLNDVNNDDEKLRILYQSFQRLDKIEKAIIYLYLEDLGHKDIAKNLGISEANARVKLHRTKEKIKSIIFKTKEYEI